MARFDKATVARWQELARVWLAPMRMQLEDVKQGRDAWLAAHKCGITGEAYESRDVTDGHIQTALEKIFPNAVFKDKKVY